MYFMLTKKEPRENFNFLLIGLLLINALFYVSPAIASANDAEEIKLLRAQMQMMMKRIDELEKKQSIKEEQAIAKAVKQEMPKKGKGVIDLMSDNTTLSVGGRIQMNTFYDWDDSKQGHLFYNVRDSRLWLKSRTRTDYGLLSATLEADFFGSDGDERTSNSHNLRLRHAYLQLGSITIGQTNSLFNSIAAPDVIAAPIDDVFVRQPQMRWTESFDWGKLAISLEQPESTLTDSSGNRVTPGTDRFPDLVTRLTWRGDWGESSVAALGREIRNDGVVADVEDEAYGGALSLSGKFLFFDYDDLRYGISYGNALGRYMAGNFFNVGSIDDQGKIQLIPAVAAHISYRHWWNESIRSSFTFAHVQAENNGVVPASSNKMGQSYSANLLWIPVENSQLGLEYLYQRTELQSGVASDLSRLLFKASYDF